MAELPRFVKAAAFFDYWEVQVPAPVVAKGREGSCFSGLWRSANALWAWRWVQHLR